MVGLPLRMMGRHEDAGPAGLRLRAWLMRHLPGQLTCMEFERFVHDYHEGSLSRRERRAFDLHMELCPNRRICATDDAAAPAELPEELAAAILAARCAR